MTSTNGHPATHFSKIPLATSNLSAVLNGVFRTQADIKLRNAQNSRTKFGGWEVHWRVILYSGFCILLISNLAQWLRGLVKAGGYLLYVRLTGISPDFDWSDHDFEFQAGWGKPTWCQPPKRNGSTTSGRWSLAVRRSARHCTVGMLSRKALCLVQNDFVDII